MATFSIPLICVGCNQESERRSNSQRYCKPCAEASKREAHRRANKKYSSAFPPRQRDPEERKRAHESHRARRPDAAKKRAARYNEKNRDEINRKAREYRARPEVKEMRREIDRRYRSKPKQRVDQRMKTSIRMALNGGKNGRSWERLVGYRLDDLIAHLERQFLKGMSWENMGEWEIDHIRPKSSFSYQSSDDPEFRACWGLSNLRPLWFVDNRSKHARRTHLL